jgi:hypothetical protein
LKTLRITLAEQPKVAALASATKFEVALAGTKGVLSRSRAGEHTAEGGRLFFYVTLDDDAQQAVGDEAANIGAQVEELGAIPKVDECLNCGNVADKPLAVCPNCHFREIAACPHCGTDVPRVTYVEAAGDLFSCPACNTHVRLVYADPLWNQDGKYSEPPVRVVEPG